MLHNLETSQQQVFVIANFISGGSDDGAVRTVRTARTANRRTAFARLRQRRDCYTTQNGAQDCESSFQPAVSPIWHYRRHQASETRNPFVQEAIVFANERYGNRIPSQREHRVIELVAQGLKNRDVADAIGTTEHVVKNYLRVIYDKLGLWNRVELALWYESRRQQPGIPAGVA
jgi:DNA-binding CsgD family transcriptional regulator